MIREYEDLKYFMIDNISENVKEIFTEEYNALELNAGTKGPKYVKGLLSKYSHIIENIEVLEDDVMAYGFHVVDYTNYTYIIYMKDVHDIRSSKIKRIKGRKVT